MAVTHDNSTSAATSAGSSLTWSHTVASGANYLTVSASANSGSPGSITGVTYNGVAMTALTTELSVTFLKHSKWYLLNPATGANNVVVTSGGGGSDSLAAGASSYSGVDVSGTPHGTVATATGNSTTPSVTVTSATGELIIAGFGIHDATITAFGETQRVNVNDGPPNVSTGMSDTAGASSVAMDCTSNSGQGWCAIGVSLKPAAAPDTLFGMQCL